MAALSGFKGAAQITSPHLAISFCCNTLPQDNLNNPTQGPPESWVVRTRVTAQGVPPD